MYTYSLKIKQYFGNTYFILVQKKMSNSILNFSVSRDIVTEKKYTK